MQISRLTLLWVLQCVLLPAPAFALEMVCPQLGAEEALNLPEPADGRLRITANQAELTQDGLSTLAGTVRLVQGGSLIEAEGLSFDQTTRQVRLGGESLFRNRDLVIRSRQAEFDLANETGTFRGAEFTLIDRAARGAAQTVRLAKAGTVDIEDVYYTTCAPGSRAWFLEASDIELDRNEGLGRARHARLRFGYVPILYAPWFQFPIDDRRRTGFLFPTVGDSDNTGLDLRIPFYVNLAPNYDLQLTPRYMSERGTQVGSEGRYLSGHNTGQLAYEYLDEDSQTDERRSYFSFGHQGLLNRRLALAAKFGEVSDTRYFEDLGAQLEAASITHLERSAQLTYTAPAAYTILARITDYQTVSETALLDPLTGAVNPDLEPYQRLPEVRIDAITRKARLGSRLGITGQYVNFIREAPPEGQRIDVNPFLRFASDQNAWYAASQLDVRHTRYVVTDPAVGQLPDPTRTLPELSIEGGLRFERMTSAGNLQTLEPRAYYLYVPYRDQSVLPQFDSGEPDFDFVQLFERNRYSGIDRISDANHLAVAFTSRLLDPVAGVQWLSGSLGQIYRFQPTRVALENCVGPGCTVDTGGTDYIGEVDWQLPIDLLVRATAQWSQDRNEFVRGSAALRYHDDPLRLDLVYRYREVLPQTDTALEQFDTSAATPLWGPVSAIARWRYSRAENRTLEGLGGLEYETCCWAVRGAYRRYQFGYDELADQPEYTTGVYFQLELKGLTRIGAGFQALLPPLD
ncbi:MAG TPA: LPS-assembly protein LptD [Verrucomicrobiae bacterium]|nr:LPS-assembly protein LptD [Verrucomicrobiae bacterium]